MRYVSMMFSYLILLGSLVMLSWGVLGFLEYFFGLVFLMPLQNPTFPSGTQFLHWLVISLSGSIYLLGYITRWRYTPIAMIVVFSMLATLCFVETFDFMTNESRYFDFARECLYYLIMSVYLTRSTRMRAHFGRMEVARAEEQNAFT